MRPGTTCSPSPRSRTSPACSTRSTGSTKRRPWVGTCCWTPRRSCPTNRLDLSRWHPDFVALVVLQDVRLPDRRRRADRTPAGAEQAAPAVVRWRDDHDGVRPGRPLLPGPRRGGLRGRDGQLPHHPGDRGRTEAARMRRPGRDPRARRVPDRLAAERAGGARARQRRTARPDLRAAHAARRAAARSRSTSTVATAGRSITASSSSGRRETHISLRTGSFCNPGAGETALDLSKEELDACFRRSPQRMRFDDFRRCIDGKSSGAVRVSLGLVSNFADALRHGGIRRVLPGVGRRRAGLGGLRA